MTPQVGRSLSDQRPLAPVEIPLVSHPRPSLTQAWRTLLDQAPMDTTESPTTRLTRDTLEMTIGETGRETVNTVTLETATSPGKVTAIIHTTSHATRTITMAIAAPMETPIAALVVTAVAAPLGRGNTTSMTMTETTEVIGPTMTGTQILKEDVQMSSVLLTTTRAVEEAIPRTSGGCLNTGLARAQRGPSTTAPSLQTNLLPCWTHALRRPRSPPRTPVRRPRDPWSRKGRGQRAIGTIGRHEACYCKLEELN